jgi:hypothetical protein
LSGIKEEGVGKILFESRDSRCGGLPYFFPPFEPILNTVKVASSA